MQWNKYISGLLMIGVLLIGGCAKQNASIVKQTYHDITGRYNALFNAEEIYHSTLSGIENSRVENYEEILPLYPYGSPQETGAQSTQFQAAIEKAAYSIQLHTISNWADDAYLLIGKSYYLQTNYEKAEQSFRYITANYKEGVDGRSDKKIKKQKYSSKRKKKEKKKEKKLIEKRKNGEDVRPKKKLFVHEPAQSEALIWLVKTFIEQEKYAEAEAIITYIKADELFLKNMDKDVELVHAYYYLKKGRNDLAATHIENTLSLIKRQKQKNRYQFILAQLMEDANNYVAAGQYYLQSVKSNPDFEMVFYAKLKLIQLASKGGYDAKDADKLLAKMLKDSKNKAFYDQLYYQKALMAIEEKQLDEAKEWLKKSIQYSVSNEKQKTNSYILLAELLYDEEAYSPSQAYYDSSDQIIDSNHPKREEVANRTLVLTQLVEQLNTIKMNDSLLTIANMDEKEREQYLYSVAVDIIEKDQSEQESVASTPIAIEQATASTSTWYFDSESSMTKGYNTFKQKWGDRALADNWRRSAAGVFSNNTDETDYEEKTFYDLVDDKFNELVAAIPLSDESKKSAEEDIMNAYFQAAIIYKDDLYNEPKAIHLLEELLRRFPKNDHELEAYYYLYLLHSQSGTEDKANMYRQSIINEYPESIFAKWLLNPDYKNALQDLEEKTEQHYEQTYQLYQNGKFQEALIQCVLAKELFPENKLQAKFDLLQAVIIGQMKDYDSFLASLKYVVETHKSTVEEEKAQELIDYLLGKKKFSAKQTSTSNRTNQKSIPASLPENKREPATPLVPETEESDKFKIKFGKKEFAIGKDDNDAASSKKGGFNATKGTVEESTTVNENNFVPKKEDEQLPVSNNTSINTTTEQPKSGEKEKTTPLTYSSFSENDNQYLIVYIENSSFSISSLMSDILSFQHSMEMDSTHALPIQFSDNEQLVVSKPFSNTVSAIAHYNEMIQSNVLKDLSETSHKVFLISAGNYATLLALKDVSTYYSFFEENYIEP